MDSSIQHVRKDYQKKALLRQDLPDNPILLLEQWLKDSASTDASDYNAMCLSTSNAEGQPDSRIVLLRSITEKGIRFFTNYRSKKGQDIASNPKVSVNFFWRDWERQVRVEGTAERCSSEVSDEYFASRPRSSQEGAWTSQQSAIDVSPEIESRTKATIEKFKTTTEIPRPEFWGGYDIGIEKIEFWQGRPSRLHNRWRYVLIDNATFTWSIEQLDP